MTDGEVREPSAERRTYSTGVIPIAALKAQMLLVTLDRGIGALALRLRPEPGVMIVRSRRLDAPGIADDVLHIVQGVRDWQEFTGHVVVADRTRLRLHPYPPAPHEQTGGSAPESPF